MMLCFRLFLSRLHMLMYSKGKEFVILYCFYLNTQKCSYLSPAADAINNAAGFGFNGYNKDGSPRWDLISNLRILDIEVRLF